jgi:sporulation protein YlmC with PRC-barrel domain
MESISEMRTTAIVFAMCLVITSAYSQTQRNTSPKAQTAAPISGIDTTALAGSARASKLIGSRIYKGDTAIGQIEDVLVALDQAAVTGIILSVGGFLGIGDKLVAVPVKQIKVGPEAKFVTDLTKEQLANAPAFEFAKVE